MLIIDENFMIDEKKNVFHYVEDAKIKTLPTENLKFCAVYADTSEIDKSTTLIYKSVSYGNIPFFENGEDLAKAVMSKDSVLTTFFIDENGIMKFHKRKFRYGEREAYKLMAQINRFVKE